MISMRLQLFCYFDDDIHMLLPGGLPAVWKSFYGPVKQYL